MSENQSIGKKIILEILDYLQYKIENDVLTLEEADSISHLLEEGLPLWR